MKKREPFMIKSSLRIIFLKAYSIKNHRLENRFYENLILSYK
jgi:hypothetical protein